MRPAFGLCGTFHLDNAGKMGKWEDKRCIAWEFGVDIGGRNDCDNSAEIQCHFMLNGAGGSWAFKSALYAGLREWEWVGGGRSTYLCKKVNSSNKFHLNSLIPSQNVQ